VSVDRGVTISVARLNKDKTVALAIAPGHKAWVQLAKGALTVNGENLTAGDGAEVHDETTLRFTASQAGEILVFDLP
jgi:redox-sensitive bicupin YhaK (pirin superfamily)